MELENRKKIRLGIFIFLGLMVLVAGIYYMGTTRQLFEDQITISAVFNNVEGLQKGNDVWFSGIKVGTVKELSLESDSLVRAKLAITENAAQFIKKDSYASIESQGLVGSKVVALSPGSPSTSSIEEGSELRAKDPVAMEGILRKVEETAEQASNLTINLKQISESVQSGEGALGKLIYDTLLVHRMEQSMALIQQSSQNVTQLTGEINKVARNLNEGDGLASRLISDEEWSREVGATIDSLKRTSTAMAKAGRDLQAFMEKLNKEKGTLQRLLQDSTMARDLHKAIINVKQGTEDLDEVMKTVNRSWILNLFDGKD